MTQQSKRDVVRIIINGAVAGDEGLRVAVAAQRERGVAIDVRVTWEQGHAAHFAEEAGRLGMRGVLAAGGDGTLSEVVQGVMKVERAGIGIGLIPMGSGNDFARTCCIPLEDPAAALAVALQSPVTEIDVGMVNGRPFINACSGGAGAEVVAETSEQMKTLLGGMAYSLKGIAKAITVTPNQLRITSETFQWEGEAFIAAVGNGRSAGGGYNMTARATLNDGLLDLVVVPTDEKGKLVGVIPELWKLSDPTTQFEKIIYRQLPAMVIEAPEGLHVNIDGEPSEGTRFEFRNIARRLRFHLPRDCEALAVSIA